MLVHDLGEELLAFDLFSVNGDDEISADHDGSVAEVGAFGAAAQSGAIGGASGNGLHDEESVVGGQAQFVGDFGIDGDGANAERGTAHASERDQIVDHSFGGVDGDGEAYAGALSDAGGDHGVDADDLAVPVEQRAAGVAGVDGGVGLNGFFDDQAVWLLHLADGTDDAAREGSGEAERIADGIDFLADLQIGRVAEDHRLQVGGFDLDYGQVMRLVGADDGGLIFLAVVQRHFNLARFGDDVIVGEDVSFFVDNETGALAFLRHQAVKEVEGHDARGYVDYRRDVLAIDVDVVLLFGVERFAAGGFGDFNALRTPDPVGGMETSAAIGGEVDKGRRQNNGEKNRTQEFHRCRSLFAT